MVKHRILFTGFEKTSKVRCIAITQFAVVMTYLYGVVESKELHSFVELALTKATDGSDTYTDCLAHLQSIGTAFYPLLFTIEESAGFEELMERSKSVFDHLAGDKELAKKWVSSSITSISPTMTAWISPVDRSSARNRWMN